MKICVTGGAGYVGSCLVPRLLGQGHEVTVLDTFWFGDYLNFHAKLTKIKGDIRNRMTLRDAFKDKDAVIHLACVSNDPSFDMNPILGREINLDSFIPLLSAVKAFEVEKFIYASSSSVYGVSDLEEVKEESPKKPLTDYSRFKLSCEQKLKDFGAFKDWTIIRPATVCGYAPRMRLDLVVNILTIQALADRTITLFGTEQKRPNIYVEDMARAYEFALYSKEMNHKTFNVGFENLKLIEIAELVKEIVGKDVRIQVRPTNDPRSYHINSDKISNIGFKPIYSIASAIESIKHAYEMGALKMPMINNDYYNIRKMKELGLS